MATTGTNTMADTTPMSEKVARPPPILCLGAVRTGTASLMKALEILGYTNVHHGWEASERDDMQWQWPLLDRAADATYPNIATYNGKGFSRSDWDEIFSEYDAVSDIGSLFAESLIKAYPDAKVIFVERDIEKWYKSALPIFEPAQNPRMRKFAIKIGDLSGMESAKASYKMHQGWTGAPDPNHTVDHMKEAYVRHNALIRENVSQEQLLDFQLTQGWEPLCAFLGKEVPDCPFPHVNDSKEYQARGKKLGQKMMGRAARNVLLPCAKKDYRVRE
ncbi:hypothetical protein NW752_004286 [Fusarium irregulare]|uniref:P-loop containing nucleoside triphosphate hydrolase protein n=1 Tax=Fusarium irregulare TaxID=2494466 RepID=A0A9W8U998_9HYPO|nr:hypothetical protein NW766_007189 [Fusarium irregulare]KAJ4021279.1 hypothetical protein NW752_004286 [Fusarium irregulare]